MRKQPSKSNDTVAMLLAFVVVFSLGDWVIARINIPQVLNGTNSCRWKWELYEQAPFTPNVAFLGSCYGLFGINSQILSQTARESGRDLSVMNLCTSSASNRSSPPERR